MKAEKSTKKNTKDRVKQSTPKSIKHVKRLMRLFKVSKGAVKHRKKLGKAIFSILFLFNNWDRSESMVRFKKK